MSDLILIPKKLTAENGAKALLIGEFYEKLQLRCPDCDGTDKDCDICKGDGYYIQEIPITWSIIKLIYKKAVHYLGKELPYNQRMQRTGKPGR